VKGVSELTIGELYQRMVHAPTGVRYLATMYHMRLAFPCATLVLGLFALAVRHWRPLVRVALGVLGCVLYVGFYFFLADPIRSGFGGRFPPIVMVWVPNVAMTTIAMLLALLARVQRVPQGMNW
jgi:lipopolysaccharide export LptBFGC system permease protein LptF